MFGLLTTVCRPGTYQIERVCREEVRTWVPLTGRESLVREKYTDDRAILFHRRPSRLIRQETQRYAGMSTTQQAGDRPADTDVEPVPEVLEWLVGAVLAIGGLVLAMGGSAILWASDERVIARAIEQGIADGSIQTDVLTPSQLTALASETAFWLGLGLVITGLGLVVVAVVYVVGRRRTRRSTGGGSLREILFAHALLGAIATGLLSFLPVSPVFGGGVAGYVHRRAGSATKAGAVSGLLAWIPVAVIGGFLAVGLGTGLNRGEVQGLGPVVAMAVVVGILVALVYLVGLSALGGYIAAVIVDDDDRSDTARGGERIDSGHTSGNQRAVSDDASTTGDTTTRGESDGDATDDATGDERDRTP